MDVSAQLIPKLQALRLRGMLETLSVRNQRVIGDKLGSVEFLQQLLQDEVGCRARKQLPLRIRRARIAAEKTLEGFDRPFHPVLNRQQILDLATGTWNSRKECP